MAETTKSKNQKSLDAFADDLDEMLATDDGGDSRRVRSIDDDDDDAIDRLLMGDNFREEVEPEADEFAGVDDLLNDNSAGGRRTGDFGDIQAGLQDSPEAEELLIDDFDEFADDANKVEEVDFVDSEELDALEKVGDIDEFADEPHDPKQQVDVASVADDWRPEDKMAEIDDFADEPDEPQAGRTNSEFPVTDFDISADDFVAKSGGVQRPAAKAAEGGKPQTPPVQALESAEVFSDDFFAEREAAVPEAAPPAEIVTPPKRPAVAAEEKAAAPPADSSAELAGLAVQMAGLKKVQQSLKLSIEDKAGKAELAECIDEIGGVRTEQKKLKRAVDQAGAKKPVAAYVANGLAVSALLFGTGLGFQGYVAKTQVAELVEIIGKMQEQANAGPRNDAADREMVRKQLDELSVAGSVAATQIAELKKALQSGGGAPAKQVTELSAQTMQIGAEIETLQSKVAALEKGRTAAAQAAKPEKKKPAPEENWAVNLIAFKQEWYAKRKADEYAGKGVPAKVSKTVSKGENWYRLSVDGFKSQYEAAGYAAKIKKMLNLDSVWVARNKD